MATSSRVLRQRSNCINYKEPKESDIVTTNFEASKGKVKSKPKLEKGLFPIEVVEEDASRCKVHYVGYSSVYDEWKEKDEIINLHDGTDSDPEDSEPPSNECGIMRRFSLYHELGTRIKIALNSNRKESPVVRIDMPFDRVEYDGGLRRLGVKKQCVRGIQHHCISRFQDLNALLGMNWHYRGINVNGDFCYVVLNTVEFYLYKRRATKEYVPTDDFKVKQEFRDPGDMLVFCFVKANGTPDQFGRNNAIFVN